MKAIACAALLLASPGIALSAPLSYDFFDLSYVQIKPDEGDIEADGFGLGLSRALSPSMFMTASLSRAETDDLTIPDVDGLQDFNGSLISTTASGGLGGHQALSPSTDFVYAGRLVFAKVEGDGSNGGALDDDDVGFGASAGIRSVLGETIEGGLGVNYISIFDDSDTSFGGSLLAHVGARVALVASVEMTDDAKAYAFGIRFKF